jgi:mycothiol synthase
MSENDLDEQLRMKWPDALLGSPPPVRTAQGYRLRTYQPGDEPGFYEVMGLAGWPGWNEEKLLPWRSRILPEGWFMMTHLDTDRIVATAMALQDMSEFGREGGELGWVASDCAHAGRGLGAALSAAVTGRLLEAGYRDIHLYTEHYRLAAIKIYLRLGYLPYLHLPEMLDRWRAVCEQLEWSFEPAQWIVGY